MKKHLGARLLAALCFLLLVAAAAVVPAIARQSAPATDNAAFLKAADEVLLEMSKILSLPVLQPLKRSVRSREEIHDYLIHNMNEDKDKAKRDADTKTMVALGLIPKDYPLDQKILALLTEQIAGLYDPKGREFFIADWTEPDDQAVIMAHELTHALEDQHFHIDKWQDSVKADDDASLAREAVLEGSATVSMLDYLLRDSGRSTRDLDGFDFSKLLGETNDDPELDSAPMVLRDELLFPYTAGAGFMLRMLKEWNGWPGLHNIFEKPPQSTQQILHPDLYLRGVMPLNVTLPKLSKILPSDWKQLDQNVLGEFGVQEIFKQFLGQERAKQLAPAWAGDRYAILEHKRTGQILLVIRVAFRSDTDAARYFGGYSEVLELKDKQRDNQVRQHDFFSFDTPAGGVFLRCFASECLSAEGTTRKLFDAMTQAVGWPVSPSNPQEDTGGGVLADSGPWHSFSPVAKSLEATSPN